MKTRSFFSPTHLICLIIVFAGIVYLAAAAYMGLKQRDFLYRTAPGWQEPAAHGLIQATRIDLRADDGTPLAGWFVAPRRDDAPVILYFHGNANGLDRRVRRFGLMVEDGSGLIAMSYRGYGASGGAPNESVIHADAMRIYRHLRENYPADRIVIFGESLGSGVALNLVRQVEAKAVILDSPFLSVMTRAQASYPWLPVSWLLVDTFRSDLWIGEAKAPVHIIHGTADRVIPASDSEKLAALGKPDNVTRKLYEGQPHVVPYWMGPSVDIPAYLKTLKQ